MSAHVEADVRMGNAPAASSSSATSRSSPMQNMKIESLLPPLVDCLKDKSGAVRQLAGALCSIILKGDVSLVADSRCAY